jgi:3-oxosteroid 1-dehydrogenase
MLCPHTIVVNRDGARFADETDFQNMVPSLRHYDVKKHRHTNLPCYLIFDQQYIDGFSFIDAPRSSEVPPWVSRGSSIEELAGKLKINAAGLATTVACFNGFARKGVDEDFKRGEASWCLAKKDVTDPRRREYISPTLGTLRIPPFYGVELHPSVFASGGLVANACAQVINQRGLPIRSLRRR